MSGVSLNGGPQEQRWPAAKSQRRSIAIRDCLMNEGPLSGCHFEPSNVRYVGGFRRTA